MIVTGTSNRVVDCRKKDQRGQNWLKRLQDRNVQRQVLGGIGLLTGIGAGLASYAVLQEPFNICMERLTIRLPHAKGRLPRAGLRILQLSDTHFQGIDWRARASAHGR